MAAAAPFHPAAVCRLWAEFPPFFTLQPNDATRQTQLEEWARLLLAHCAAHTTTLVAPLADWPWWENRALQRALPPEGVAAVAEHLVAARRAEWADAQRVNLRVYFKTVEELAVLVLAAVKAHGYVDELHTLEELSGELGRGEAFYRLEDDIMVRVCELLKAQGHATIVYAPAFGVIFKSDKMSM